MSKSSISLNESDSDEESSNGEHDEEQKGESQVPEDQAALAKESIEEIDIVELITAKI